jgi:hypothetical protein
VSTAARLSAHPSDADLDQLLAACGLTTSRGCGTVAGYMQHLKHKQTPCDACQQAFTAAQPGWLSKPRQRRPAEHGTAAGARAHQKRREAACGPCARAYRAYQTANRAARKARTAA